VAGLPGRKNGTSLIFGGGAWPAGTAKRELKPETRCRLPHPRFRAKWPATLHARSYLFHMFIFQRKRGQNYFLLVRVSWMW
jgi:hypothetical protein